jgi:hypothetical protein
VGENVFVEDALHIFFENVDSLNNLLTIAVADSVVRRFAARAVSWHFGLVDFLCLLFFCEKRFQFYFEGARWDRGCPTGLFMCA